MKDLYEEWKGSLSPVEPVEVANPRGSIKTADPHRTDIRLVTFHFNPSRHKELERVYKKWIPSMKNVSHLMRAYELVFDDDEPEIPGATVIRGTRDKNLMWQKEALINIGLRECEDNIKYFGWIDHDVLFTNGNWINDSIEKLQEFDSVQPLSNVYILEEDCKGIAHDSYTPGLAWLANRDYMDKRGGLYPYCIVGGGDTLFPMSPKVDVLPNSILQDNCMPMNNFYNLPQSVFHIWHGDRKKRQYETRQDILNRNNFKPTDIKINDDGILEWTRDDPQMKLEIEQFFSSREG